MANEKNNFYDDLANDYHLIFADWRSSVIQQGKILDKLIQAKMDRPGLAVLDCSCGIGTQAIGLAMLGYLVHATDLSRASVERAAREAAGFGLKLTTGVADFRELANQVEGTFEVVIACDNSLPHLLTDADMRLALHNIFEKVKPGGLFLMSMRDYDELLKEKPRATTPNVFNGSERRYIVFQVWDWQPLNNIYTLNHFIVKQENSEEWQTFCRSVEYRAWQREELTIILNEEGFSEVRWQFTDQSGYYQPVLTARKLEGSRNLL